jgi:hypothetical protein
MLGGKEIVMKTKEEQIKFVKNIINNEYLLFMPQEDLQIGTQILKCVFPELLASPCSLPFTNVNLTSPRTFSPQIQQKIMEIVMETGEMEVYLTAVRRFCLAWAISRDCPHIQDHIVPFSCVAFFDEKMTKKMTNIYSRKLSFDIK